MTPEEFQNDLYVSLTKHLNEPLNALTIASIVSDFERIIRRAVAEHYVCPVFKLWVRPEMGSILILPEEHPDPPFYTLEALFGRKTDSGESLSE